MSIADEICIAGARKLAKCAEDLGSREDGTIPRKEY